MVLSYSAIAKPTADTPKVISMATSKQVFSEASEALSARAAEDPQEVESQAEALAQTSTSTAETPVSSEDRKVIQHLILDAGPLLSLTPLRHLATSFHTTPMVLAELRDPKAREHWERLALTGVSVKVEPPTAEAMAQVTAFAKKTGDFAVLSLTDLSVAALTYQYEIMVNGGKRIRTEPPQAKKPGVKGKEKDLAKQAEKGDEEVQENKNGKEGKPEEKDVGMERMTQSLNQIAIEPSTKTEFPEIDVPITNESQTQTSASAPVHAEDPESEGEWINPTNLSTHRSRDLGLITPSGSTAKPPAVACMTGDYAVQNILLGMRLGLVGEGGKKIGKVKSWVLRCHACFKICKDPSKRFCPSCGNATLLRTSISTSAKTGEQRVHLKQNFQYRTRGTIYSIPDPKMGRAKGQQKGGSGLILREDQREWQDAMRGDRIKKEKEEKRAAKGALEGWNDPDWLPEMITVGMSGKGRSGGHNMPSIGHGRKNPNQAKRRR
ncbi:RNA-binding protein NOB1 [Cryptococcus bacillisporus CA1873]|uniref:20S-pre-rRNA D-site endonuclease NOB1 n=1 Tax=Cryptococcus bacillisporus CA1873 TaxID=1296111 RepID=A0ABR5BJG3_CRYGA|nr:RNA-binding protein NOB1 [Cryptococcus bacillisporus CA1873]|eukprot:KIR69309.1 RNA-binding protein NOB1 [Cryptococcus gattii CA1873]